MIYTNKDPAADQAMENHHWGPDESKLWCHCDECGGGIYLGEEYYYFNDPEELLLCDSCVLNWSKKYLHSAKRTAGEQDD